MIFTLSVTVLKFLKQKMFRILFALLFAYHFICIFPPSPLEKKKAGVKRLMIKINLLYFHLKVYFESSLFSESTRLVAIGLISICEKTLELCSRKA